MNECLTIGEPLVVFAAEEADVPLAAAKHFTKYLAGAELNVAVGLSRLGHSSSTLRISVKTRMAFSFANNSQQPASVPTM